MTQQLDPRCPYGFERHLPLPCNVVVQDAADGGVTVSIADPRVMFSLVSNPALAPVVEDADERLRRVMASLG